MTKTKRDSTKVLWIVQYRTARDRAWRNRAGRFETRKGARAKAVELRAQYGFGNTKAVPYVRGAK